jgi:pimeloyl-ACP methyl ester carboxylesterase
MPAATATAATPGELAPLDRGFLRLREGLVHYRAAGVLRGANGTPAARVAPEAHARPVAGQGRDGAGGRAAPLPVYMVHAGPGSSRGLEGIVQRLGTDRFVIAPDTLGAGDSAAPDVPVPEVPYYAESVVRTLDALGLERVDYYGSHTGAHIGCELALRWPERVRRMVFDGITLFPPALRAELLERYAPPMQPDEFGRQLAWAWQFVRDMSLFFPHYARDRAHRLDNPVSPPEALHRSVVEVLKALPTYHLAYHAVFRHDIEARLPLLRLPVLCLGREGDPMGAYVDRAVTLIPGATPARVGRTEGAAGVVEALRRFLG